MVVDDPFDARPGSRRLSDLLHVGSRRPPGAASDEPARSDASERVLRAAVEALLGLAQRTPGIDLTVSLGPGPGPAVRLHYTQEGLVADRLTPRGRVASRETVGPVLDESEVVTELASLLRSGEVEPL